VVPPCLAEANFRQSARKTRLTAESRRLLYPLLRYNGRTRADLPNWASCRAPNILSQPTPRRPSANGCCGRLAIGDLPLCRVCAFTRARPPTPPAQRRCAMGERSQRLVARALVYVNKPPLPRETPGRPQARQEALSPKANLLTALYRILTSLSSRFDRCRAIEYNRSVCVKTVMRSRLQSHRLPRGMALET
jgi:hypothetical protein